MKVYEEFNGDTGNRITEHDIAAAVARLADRFPYLSVDGLQTSREAQIRRQPLGDVVADAIKWREQVVIARAWLWACESRKTFRRHTDTYSYKHEIEADCGRWIPHAAFLVAAELVGMEMVPNPDRPWAGLLKLGKKRPGAWV